MNHTLYIYIIYIYHIFFRFHVHDILKFNKNYIHYLEIFYNYKTIVIYI
jgi:hypothetical protein